MFTIENPDGEKLRVLLSGEIDHHTASEMRAGIDDAIAVHRPAALVLDFGGVTFMDSSGIGLVMGRYKLMHSMGGTVSIANIPKPLRRVMSVAGLHKIAEIDSKGESHECL